MLEKMDLALIGAKMKMDDYVDRLLHEEKGASDIVAILVALVISVSYTNLDVNKRQG